MRTLILAVSLALVATVATAREMKPGHDRWLIKTTVEPGAELDVPSVVTFDTLASLPNVPGIRKNDPRFQLERIPQVVKRIPQTTAPDLREGAIVQVDSWVQLVAQESDGDYSLQVTADEHGSKDCLILKVPNPGERFTFGPAMRPVFQQVRDSIKEAYLHGREPSPKGSILKPVRMRFIGQLYYDDSHVGMPPRGRKGCHAPNLWEIHPITSAEVLQ
jgi:hypothetical protein